MLVLQVADLIKADRLVRLNAVVNEIAEERAQRFLGRTLEVTSLVAGISSHHDIWEYGKSTSKV